MTHTITIRFLDTPETITVVAPLPLTVSWGDRVSRTDEGPHVYGSLVGADYGTPDDLRVEAGQLGDWWARNPVMVRASRDGYGAELTVEQREEVLATYEAVRTAWQQGVRENPAIAEAVEGCRKIQDSILADHEAHDARWERDVQTIAQMFRRRSVVLGEQTVPGRVCVRSTRGTLLGYADVWDGAWKGTVERI